MIKTWVLILLIGSNKPNIVPDYGSAAECEQARTIIQERWKMSSNGVCIPGPVRPN